MIKQFSLKVRSKCAELSAWCITVSLTRKFEGDSVDLGIDSIYIGCMDFVTLYIGLSKNSETDRD